MVLVPQFAKRVLVVPQLVSRVSFSPNHPNLLVLDYFRPKSATSAGGSLQGSPEKNKKRVCLVLPHRQGIWYLPFLEQQTESVTATNLEIVATTASSSTLSF
jgi:hypothetical protein